MRPPRGKLSPEALARLVAPHLGAARSEVLVGPRAGVDCAIVRVGEGRVMAVTTDPLSIVPALGLADSARLACHLVASDLWTTGIAPAYAAVSLQLPLGLDDADLGAFAAAMGAAWDALGVAVVTGHTGRYDGCEGTIVGAATLFGFGDEHRYVGPAFVAAGDRVLITKGCAIETTAIAARLDEEDYRAIGFHDAVRVGHLPLDAVRRFGDPETLFFNVNSPDDLAQAEELWRQRVSSR